VTVDCPHFDLPFRFENGAAVVVEQDTTEDVAACVAAVLLYPLEWRPEAPTFGIRDPTFTEGGVDTADVARALAEWEPRADLLVSGALDDDDELAQIVTVALGVESPD
jgi:hypothetical protein